MDHTNVDGTREAHDEDTLVVDIARRAAAIAAEKTSEDEAADLSQQVALECLARLRRGTLVIHRKSLGGLARTMANGRRIDGERQRRTRTGSEAQYCLDNADHVHPWMSADVQLEEGELDRFYRRVLDSLKPRARLTFIMVREQQRESRFGRPAHGSS
jgi:DNA-directed RNA polymerase specialized sigma24 family protein